MSALLGQSFQRIGPILLDVKWAGTRSAGNPHAACERAGSGDGLEFEYRATPRPYRSYSRASVDGPRRTRPSSKQYWDWASSQNNGLSIGDRPRATARYSSSRSTAKRLQRYGRPRSIGAVDRVNRTPFRIALDIAVGRNDSSAAASPAERKATSPRTER